MYMLTHACIISNCPQLLLKEELVHNILEKTPQPLVSQSPNGTQSLLILSVITGGKWGWMLQKPEKNKKFRMCFDEVFTVEHTGVTARN